MFSTTASKAPKDTKKHRFPTQQEDEKELILLSRRYEVLDRERARSELTGFSKLSKAGKVFEIFKNEYENVLKDLNVATAPAKLKQDDIQYNMLSCLLQENEIYNEEAKLQKTYMAELDQQIYDVAKNVRAFGKLEQITDYQGEESLHNARNTLETLENKLDVEKKKFNMIVTQNAYLRDEIDHLLWNRRNFMTLWDKLIDRLTIGKRIMLDLIQQASTAYDQREEWCTKLQLLRVTGHRDYVNNLEQMRRYRQGMDNALKTEQFMSTKGQKRVMKDLIRKNSLKRTEQKMKMGKKLSEYRHMLKQIQEFTEQTQMKVIAQKYHQRENENFSKFQFVIKTMSDIESIGDNLGFLHTDIEKQNKLHKVMEAQQTKAIKILEGTFDNVTQETKQVKDDIQQLDNKLKVLMEDIVGLFTLCQCDKDPLLQLLGDQTSITHYNVLLYLELLEKTISCRLLQASYKTRVDKSSRRLFSEESVLTRMYSIDRIVREHPCALCVEHEMVSDVIEKAERVWSREEVKERLQSRICAPDAHTYLHTLSKCHLPQARRIMQLKYT